MEVAGVELAQAGEGGQGLVGRGEDEATALVVNALVVGLIATVVLVIGALAV